MLTLIPLSNMPHYINDCIYNRASLPDSFGFVAVHIKDKARVYSCYLDTIEDALRYVAKLGDKYTMYVSSLPYPSIMQRVIYDELSSRRFKATCRRLNDKKIVRVYCVPIIENSKRLAARPERKKGV